MTIEIVLVPDFFRPKWTKDADYFYLILQPYLVQKLGGESGATTTRLSQYLKGFSVPRESSIRPKICMRLYDPNTDTGAEANGNEYIPVPLPDTVTLHATASNKNKQSIDELPGLQRDFRTFATIRSHSDFITANRIYPRMFSILDENQLPKRIPKYWWIPKNDPANDCQNDPANDYQPEWYNDRATYAQMLAHQMRQKWAAPADTSEKRQSTQRIETQLRIAFMIGKLFRLFTDAGELLFEHVPGDLRAQMMIVPDLKPNETWDNLPSIPNKGPVTNEPCNPFTRWHTNIHSMCGLVWPVATKGMIEGLPETAIPHEIELSFTVPDANQTITNPDDKAPIFQIGERDGKNPIFTLFDQLNKGTVTKKPSVKVSRPEHLQDIKDLVFAVNKSQNLVLEHGLTRADKTHSSTSFVYYSESDQVPEIRADRKRPALAYLNPNNYVSLSLLSDTKPEQRVQVDLKLVVPGRLVPYRRFRNEADAAQQLLIFEPDQPLDKSIVDKLKERLNQTSALKTDLLAFGYNPKRALNLDQVPIFPWENVQEDFVYAEGSSSTDPKDYRPVFFLDEMNEDKFQACQHRALLLFSVKTGITGRWQAAFDSKNTALEKYLWRTDQASWPTQDGILFNVVTCNIPHDPNHSLGATLWHMKEFDFHFARSARHLWLPLKMEFDPIPTSWLDKNPEEDAIEQLTALDGWNHKELNVYIRDTSNNGNFEMMNRENLLLPNLEASPIDPDGMSQMLRWYLYLFIEQPEDKKQPELYPAPDSEHCLRYPNWPHMQPLRPPRLTEKVGQQQELALAVEHQYGTQIFGMDDTGPWHEVFDPFLDWPFTDPTTIKKTVQGVDDDGEDVFFLRFQIPEPKSGNSKLILEIKGSWLIADDGLKDSDRSEEAEARRRLAIQTRRAAMEFLTAQEIHLLIHGYVFDLTYGEDESGTRHDRHFSQKLRPVFFENSKPYKKIKISEDTREEILKSLRLDTSDPHSVPHDKKVEIDLRTLIHEQASLVECQLELTRPVHLIPPKNRDYWIVRPKLGLEGNGQSSNPFSLPASDLLDPGTWAARFQDVSDEKIVKEALKDHLVSLTTLRSYITPHSDRSAKFRARHNLLTTRSHAMAPEGFVKEQTRQIRHAVVPLAFLPLAHHPLFFESTREIFLLLLSTLAAYNDLRLNAFKGFDKEEWRNFFEQHNGGRLELKTLRKAIASTLQPIARRGVNDDNLAGKLAKAWKILTSFKLTKQALEKLKNEDIPEGLKKILEDLVERLKDKDFATENEFLNALIEPIGREQLDRYKKLILKHARILPADKPLHWPQTYAEKLLHTDLNIYAETKALLVHALKAKTGTTFPNYFYKMDVTKDVTEQDSSGQPLLSVDLDTFTYQQTTTHRPVSPDPELDALLVGDLLDDLTYDNEFEIEALRYYSAEEFIESLEPVADQGERGTEPNSRGNESILPSVIRLDSGGMELPFGSSKNPNDENEQALIGLIAHRAPSRPLIIFQRVFDEDEQKFGDNLKPGKSMYLKDLDAIAGNDPFADGRSGAEFMRANVVESDNWGMSIENQVDVVIASVLISIEADEEGQLNRDMLLFRQRDPEIPSESGEEITRPPLDQADIDEKLRKMGPLAQTIKDILCWLKGDDPSLPNARPKLEDWMAALVRQNLISASQSQKWDDGHILFNKKTNDEPESEPVDEPEPEPVDEPEPVVESIQLDTGHRVDAMRVSLFRPLELEPEQKRGALHLVAVEIRLAAGEVFSSLGFRLVRNVQREYPNLPFDPDPRFIQLSRPAQRPTPFRVAKTFNFAKKREERPDFSALQIPTSKDQAWNLLQFRQKLLEHGIKFRREKTLKEDPVRIAVYHEVRNPSPRLGYGRPKGSVLEHAKIFENGHERLFREAELLFRFNEPGMTPDADIPKIFLPADHSSYLIDVVCVSANNTPFLRLLNIPAIPKI